MKLNGFVGKGSGKLGSSVFAISGGEQIVRVYNPQVSNPNTDAQVAQRAKLKLMSQLAAALAPALGFKKQGLVSARNQFISKNIGQADYQDNEASIALEEIQLTNSSTPIPSIVTEGEEGGVLNVELESAANGDIKRVVYVVYEVTEDETLRYVASKVVSEAGAQNKFPDVFNLYEGSFVVYAYGVKDTNSDATIKYENYIASSTDGNASLQVVELFRSALYGLTMTTGARVGLAG